MIDFTESRPESASSPRLLTVSHPDAVGSYAADAMEVAERYRLHPKISGELRWWQRLVLHRALEHDADGVLCWRDVILSAPRQTGKSWLERIVCAWRIHQSDRWGEQQTLLHVAHKLVAAHEVWRPAARGLIGAGASIRWTNGEQQIEMPDGSRWMIQAANDGAGVAFSLSMALVDEGWRVRRQVVDEAIGPTVAESVSPQIWLVSTAGTSDSDLMSANRAAALADLDAPQRGSTCLIEWSAPPDPELDIDDERVWRDASPHWDERRLLAMRTARSKASERAFRQQWLNQWVPSETGPILTEEMYTAALTNDAPFGELAFGVEVATDRNSAVIVAAGGGVLEVAAARDGVGWLADWLRERVLRHRPVAVAFDALGPGASIAAELRDELGQTLMMLNGRQVAAASGLLYDRLSADPPTVAIQHHDALYASVLAANRRTYGQTWVFSRDVLGGISGAPLAAAALALYAVDHAVAPVSVERSQIW